MHAASSISISLITSNHPTSFMNKKFSYKKDFSLFPNESFVNLPTIKLTNFDILKTTTNYVYSWRSPLQVREMMRAAEALHLRFFQDWSALIIIRLEVLANSRFHFIHSLFLPAKNIHQIALASCINWSIQLLPLYYLHRQLSFKMLVLIGLIIIPISCLEPVLNTPRSLLIFLINRLM